MISAGWTLSPLQPEYLEGGRPSHQCLVTLVLKLDLGGWLTSSGGSLMAALLQPIMNTFLGTSVRDAFLHPLMMSVISLRDKVLPSPPLLDVCESVYKVMAFDKHCKPFAAVHQTSKYCT